MDHLRTSEEERQRVVAFLSGCCAEGYLDIDELDERQSRVLHSRTRGELAAEVSDMPEGHTVVPGLRAAPPTFVRPGRGSAAPLMVAFLVVLSMLVVMTGSMFELLLFAGFAFLLGAVIFVGFVSLSPWLAAGALVVWGVNRLSRRSAPPQLP